jgi:hypothetical protein
MVRTTHTAHIDKSAISSRQKLARVLQLLVWKTASDCLNARDMHMAVVCVMCVRHNIRRTEGNFHEENGATAYCP